MNSEQNHILKKGVDYPAITVFCLLHDGEGNYLLNRRGKKCRDEHEKWDLCGGAVEMGYTVEETVKKEVREEFGTDVLDIKFMGFRDIHRKTEEGPTHWIGLDFKVHINKNDAKNNEPHKFDEIGWFPLEEFPDPMHSQWPYFREKNKDFL